MTHSSGKSTMSLSAQLIEDANDLDGVGGRVGDRRPGRGAGDADKPVLVHVRYSRALPWADLLVPLRGEELDLPLLRLRPEGQSYASPGQRPGRPEKQTTSLAL